MSTVPLSPDGAGALATKGRGLTLALLTTTYFFSIMDRQILAILQEMIRADLQLSDTQLGLLAGFAFAVFYAALGIPVARYADHNNRVNVIAVSLVLWSLMTALCGLAQNFLQLLLARIGVGVGEAGSSPPSHSIIADLYPPEKRAGAMGIYSLGVVFGSALGTAVGGTVAHFYGWRAAMFTVGLPGVLLAIVIKLVMTEPRRGLSDSPNFVNGGSGQAAPPLGQSIRAFWADRVVFNLAMAITVTSLIAYGHAAFSPSFMQRSLDIEMIDVARIIAPVGAIMGTLSALGGGWLANKLAQRYGLYAQSWMVLGLKAIGLPLSVAFYMLDDPRVAIPVFMLSILLISSYVGPTFALIQARAPLRMRALWAALTLLLMNLIGLGVGPTFIGFVSDLFRPSFGEESLRWAMLTLAAATPWALWHYWRAGLLLKRETEAQTAGSREPSGR